ncbi:MAG: glucosylglycerol hydrolase, partial [Cyanobacteria bacterium J06639_1]
MLDRLEALTTATISSDRRAEAESGATAAVERDLHSPISLDLDATQELLSWVEDIEQSDETLFGKARAIAAQLGMHCSPDGSVSIGFWAPELAPGLTIAKDAYLEVFTPLDAVDLSQSSQTIRFRRDCIRLQHQGEFVWGVLRG